MPLTQKGEEIKSALTKEYGEKKGEQVLYAGKNKGTFTGIDSDTLARIADCADRLSARLDAMVDAEGSQSKSAANAKFSEAQKKYMAGEMEQRELLAAWGRAVSARKK